MEDNAQKASRKLDEACALLKEVDLLDNTLTDSICVALLLLNRSRQRSTGERTGERIEVSFKMIV
jgi:hypothetical protein